MPQKNEVNGTSTKIQLSNINEKCKILNKNYFSKKQHRTFKNQNIFLLPSLQQNQQALKMKQVPFLKNY
jgi:hypothetical protein